MDDQQLVLPGLEAERDIEESWDFPNVDTQYGTHGLFPYPARMIPQIAEHLMSIFLPSSYSSDTKLADPFCGSGTVLVEASMKGISSVGSDLNPLAVLLSRVKSTPIDLRDFTEKKERVLQELSNFDCTVLEDYLPQLHNLDHWFKKPVTAQLTWIRRSITRTFDDKSPLDDNSSPVVRVFSMAFLTAVMRCSNVNWKSSRYIRTMTGSKLEYYNPDAILHFRSALMDIEKRLRWYSRRSLVTPMIVMADARCLPLDDESIDLIITSPPYGEERNTIPYVRWSKLFLAWLGLTNRSIVKVQSEALGGDHRVVPTHGEIPSKTFWNSVKGVEEKRIREASPFLRDYKVVMEQMYRISKKEGHICIVIGNRSISRQALDMGAVTMEIGESIGLRSEVCYSRKIPKKMIAWTGPTGETISRENIVILRKL